MIRVKALILLLTLLSGCASTKVTILSVGVGASAVADAQSTVSALDKGHAEANPLAPFVDSRAKAYAFKTATSATVICLSNFMYERDNKLWWILPVAAIGLNTGAAIHNWSHE